jgi:aspartyl-tRNA(Asn)/glutamyl-tRNA(Gln) amidotransferase subunit C
MPGIEVLANTLVAALTMFVLAIAQVSRVPKILLAVAIVWASWIQLRSPMKNHASRSISTIDGLQVRHIAHLARLGLSDAECESFSKQLSTIIDYFNLLQEANVEGVLPANHLQTLRAKLRPDTAMTSLTREEFLANVPRKKDGYVRVAPIYPKNGRGPDEGSNG